MTQADQDSVAIGPRVQDVRQEKVVRRYKCTADTMAYNDVKSSERVCYSPAEFELRLGQT